jgi:hypothetical protein
MAQTVARPVAETALPTRVLLGCGVAAGPIYVGVALVQAVTRRGFDLAHDDISVLANGDLGWIQAGNLLISGLLTVACAVGVRRALGGGKGGTWGPLLLGGYGAGVAAAGLFRADPANGFPPGTPPGRSASVSWHSMLHLVCGGIGFLALIAACFVLATRFRSDGHRSWAIQARITGVVFLAGFAGIASGSTDALVVISFAIAVVIAWAWITLTAARLMATPPRYP